MLDTSGGEKRTQDIHATRNLFGELEVRVTSRKWNPVDGILLCRQLRPSKSHQATESRACVGKSMILHMRDLDRIKWTSFIMLSDLVVMQWHMRSD
jgi:hypothetical protein